MGHLVHANLPDPGKVAVLSRQGDAAGPATKRVPRLASPLWEAGMKPFQPVAVTRKLPDCRAGSVSQIVVPLPATLSAYGERTLASLCGPAGAPLVIVLGGISADRFPCARPEGGAGWWSGLAGVGRAVDPGYFRILGLDFAADENGKVAPASREQAEIVCAALDATGEAKAHAIVGASYGGMVALALGEHFPERVERLVVVSAAAEPHPTATAMRELQRRVAALGLATGQGDEGLAIARGLAMMTYRTATEFGERFAGGITEADVLACSEPGSYLRARGEAYRAVMSPERFLSLSAAIDRHNARPEAITAPTLLIGALSDQLVLPSQMSDLACRLGGPHILHLLPSLYGHDMFLKEAELLSDIVAPFLRTA